MEPEDNEPPDTCSSIQSSLDSLSEEIPLDSTGPGVYVVKQQSERDSVASLNSEQDLNPPPSPKKKKKKKKPRFILTSSNFLSQVFFYWVFRLVWISHHVADVRHIILALRPSETAQITGNILQSCWDQEIEERGESFLLM